jgi:hypothetical protein
MGKNQLLNWGFFIGFHQQSLREQESLWVMGRFPNFLIAGTEGYRLSIP